MLNVQWWINPCNEALCSPALKALVRKSFIMHPKVSISLSLVVALINSYVCTVKQSHLVGKYHYIFSGGEVENICWLTLFGAIMLSLEVVQL